MTTRWSSTTCTAAAILTVALGLAACGSDGSSAKDTTTSSAPAVSPALQAEAIEHYADGVHATYSASLASAKTLDTAVDAFVAAPTDATLGAARDAWLAARPDYGLTEAFRFYGGPIDDEETGPEGRINAWPLDEAYIDGVEGNATAGIVNDPTGTPAITAEVLSEANESGAETNISTGWHAIEFLLWGQDLSATSAGTRPVTDYTTAANADRRKEYLTVASDLLVADLQDMVDAWAPEADNYRAEFLGLPADEALTKIITGIGELSRGELAGERMTVAYEERSQENEHSCFSDNTTADLLANEEGIRNVWTGDYPGLEAGTGIRDVVAAVDETLADRTTNAIDSALARIGEIPAPFDQWLTDDASDDAPGRVAILESTELLSTQADDIVASAKAIDITIEVS